MADSNIYTIGGTVQAGGGIYLARQADQELLELCRSSKFAYVLTSRQMGKSSLMVRTAEQLSAEGVQSVIIDLTQIGVQVTAEEWYLGLLTIIEDQVTLDTDVVQWWQTHRHLGFTQRLTRFFQKILLTEITTSIVIFIDEIDTTLSLDFADDFFAAIRFLYTNRACASEFERLSFVLVGVATPSDLIKDPKRTPFNIGQRVELTDFTFEEALPLADGLGASSEKSHQVLIWILKWTNGHPYLTQRLCQALAFQNQTSISETDVDQTVEDIFMGYQSQQDNNLQFVRDMLIARSPNTLATLKIYRQILHGFNAVIDEERSIIKSHLKLSGIAYREDGILRMRNLIYKEVFDEKWIKDNLPSTRPDIRFSLIGSAAMTAIVLGLRLLGLLQVAELKSFDLLMRSRPAEPLDDRILIISIDESDIQYQDSMGMKRNGRSLSDEAFLQLLDKLKRYQPSAIGLNIFRDFSANQELANHMKNNSDLFAICLVDFGPMFGISPPPEIPEDRIGFSNIIIDSDNTSRRDLLYSSQTLNNKICNPNLEVLAAFSLNISLHYLDKFDFQLTFDETSGHLVLNSEKLMRINSFTGGYQRIDSGGYQTFINYRNSSFSQVSLTSILSDSSPFRLEQIIKGKIVLIGASTPFFDELRTPYGQMSGTVIEAHRISQLISAALDDRPLIWVFPLQIEIIGIFCWSLVGGLIAWYFQSPLHFTVAIVVIFATLFISCWGLFSFFACWAPLVPSGLVIMLSSSSIVFFSSISNKRRRASDAFANSGIRQL